MLVDKTKELIDKVDEFMKEGIKQMVDVADLMDMDTEEFEMMKKYKEFMDLSKELLVEQAKTLDDINTKLDLLIESK